MNAHYTQEQIDCANKTDLAEFLRSQGETLIKSGRESCKCVSILRRTKRNCSICPTGFYKSSKL